MKDSYLNSLLGENEQIILVTRQHWLVLAGEILTESVLAIAIVVLISLIRSRLLLLDDGTHCEKAREPRSKKRRP